MVRTMVTTSLKITCIITDFEIVVKKKDKFYIRATVCSDTRDRNETKLFGIE